MTQTSSQKLIDPMVALAESQALVEHYRNRNLILAQEKRELEVQIAGMQLDQPDPTEAAIDAETIEGDTE